jgi:ribose transport system substrate-binding protein
MEHTQPTQSTRSRSRARRLARLGTAVSAAGALALAGAGASAGASARAPHGSSGAISASELAKLAKQVQAAEAVPRFVPPGPPVSAKVLKGKSALVMPINSEIDTCEHQAKSFQSLGQSLGMHVTLFNNSGDPTQWITGIDDATSARDNALVMLCGIIPGAVGPQLEAAERAGVKVVDGNYNEVTNYKLLDAENGVEVQAGMENDVQDALVNLRGKPLHALLVTSSSVVQGPASITAVQHEIQTDCPKVCTLDEVINVPIQDWATQTQSDVSSALQAHKDVNAVFVAFDGMTTFVDPAIESAHRGGLKVYTWGGSASVEKLMLQKNSIIAANPAPDETWDAYEAMDQVIRLLNHKPPAPVSKEVLPNRFWVPSNVKQFFGPGYSYGNQGYGGNAFINGFRKLWGLPPIK